MATSASWSGSFASIKRFYAGLVSMYVVRLDDHTEARLPICPKEPSTCCAGDSGFRVMDVGRPDATVEALHNAISSERK